MTSKQRDAPANWEWVTLKTIADINPKLPFELKDEVDVSFIPMKRVEEETGRVDLSESRKYGKVKKGYTKFINNDIICAKITPCMENGKVAILKGLQNGVGFGSTEFHVIRMKDESLSTNFYFYFLLQKWFRDLAAQNFTGTVGQRRVPTDFMKEVLVPLPPFNEQVRIVGRVEELFSRLDAGVRSLQAAQTQLEQYRHTTLRQAYTGKLTQKWRHEKHHLSEAENKYTIPETWKHLSIEEISLKITDCLHSTPKFVEKGKYCIDTTCIKPNKIESDKVRYVSEETYKERIRRLKPEHGDILFSREGTIGTALIVPENIELCLGQRMMMFRPNNNIFSKYFMWGLLSPIFQNQWKPKVTGTTAPHVNIRDIRKMTLPIAPLDEQNMIIKNLEEKISQSDYILKEIEQIFQVSSNLKNSILKRAFEGRLGSQDPNDESAQVLLERIKALDAKKRKVL